MPSTVSIPTQRSGSSSAGPAILTIWALTFPGARALLDKDLQLASWIRLAAALAPILPTALLLRYAVSAVRNLDELHRRVHPDAPAIFEPDHAGDAPT